MLRSLEDHGTYVISTVIKTLTGVISNLVAEFISPQKVYTFPFIVGSIIPKSVKCIHSATKVIISGLSPILTPVTKSHDPLSRVCVEALTANPRKLEHGFRRIRARIPYTLP